MNMVWEVGRGDEGERVERERRGGKRKGTGVAVLQGVSVSTHHQLCNFSVTGIHQCTADAFL